MVDVWPDWKVDQLKLLAGQHLSGGEIAREMNMTRNQIIGKAKRIGVRLTGKPVNPPKPMSARAAPRVRNKMLQVKPLSLVTAPKPIPAMPTTKADPVHILDVRPHHCRAVLDERGAGGLAMFCGAPKVSESSYCKLHTQLFIQPPKETIHGKASYRE